MCCANDWINYFKIHDSYHHYMLRHRSANFMDSTKTKDHDALR